MAMQPTVLLFTRAIQSPCILLYDRIFLGDNGGHFLRSMGKKNKKTHLSILSQRSSPGRNRRVNEDMDLQIFILWLYVLSHRAVQVNTNKAPLGASIEIKIAMIGTSHAFLLGVALSCLMSPHWKFTAVLYPRCICLTFYSPPGRERGRKLRWLAGAQKQSYMILQWDL